MKKLSWILLSVLFLSIILGVLAGCCEGTDPRLLHADSLMEEHPDSALAILESYHLPKDATGRDRAMYGMLLSQARYKNFIDETDDSLINASVDYFLEKGMKEESARALFHAGKIRINAGKLGEAAVLFHKGLDMAHDSKSYMWEGQCARGLFILYGDLMNGSEQIRYAKASFEAFSKGKFQDWANYASLNVLRAYNNNGQYEKSLTGAQDLLKTAKEQKDTMLISEILVLLGTTQYALGNYKESIENYSEACGLYSGILTKKEKFNIAVAASKIEIDSLSANNRDIVKLVGLVENSNAAYMDFENKGLYKEAYESLKDYSRMQDSVLSVIRKNSVSELVGQYEDTRWLLQKSKTKIERLTWLLTLLILLIIIGGLVLLHKKRIFNTEKQREALGFTIESLKTDLHSQMEKLKSMTDNNKAILEKNQEMSEALVGAIRDKYSEVNELCDAYYEDRLKKARREKASEQIKKIIDSYTDEEFLDGIGMFIDKYMDNLYSSFRQDFPDLSEDMVRLFIYLTLRFSPRTISVFLKQEMSAIYNRKSRLKSRIKNSGSFRKEEYLKMI